MADDRGKVGRHGERSQSCASISSGCSLAAADADGVFLDVAPEEEEHDGETTTPTGSEGSGEDEVAQLQSALREALGHKMLQDEVCLLKSQLENERKRVKEMWYKNCDQLHEFDEILAAR